MSAQHMQMVMSASLLMSWIKALLTASPPADISYEESLEQGRYRSQEPQELTFYQCFPSICSPEQDVWKASQQLGTTCSQRKVIQIEA